nr:uncharacterized protein LOC111427476 [Onthophagus taurus]
MTPRDVKEKQKHESILRQFKVKLSIFNDVSCTSHTLSETSIQTLLSSACVRAYDKDGHELILRALLDSGSQSNFLTRGAADLLGLEKREVQSLVGGLGTHQTKITSAVDLNIKSLHSNYEESVNCLIIDKIAENIPMTTFNRLKLPIPDGIPLADVDFNKSRRVDLLLGSPVFWSCLLNKQIHMGKNMPILHQTKLGYILAGTGSVYHSKQKTNTFCAITEQLARFWEQEELPERTMNDEESACERIFEQTTKREVDGRFVVDIPFRENLTLLGESRTNAQQRLQAMERRFSRDENLSVQYRSFISEYQDLGHLSPCLETENEAGTYYLAHHAVLKESSSTTKLRTVFDGSAVTDTGLSLNDVQMKGPIVQSDLFDILIRFRKHKYVLGADVEKMYRQVLINPSQRKYQRILWRNNVDEKIKCYELNTVTYGLTSFSYLATRCLKQLAIENQHQYPSASKAIQEDFYVDDLLTGVDSLEKAQKMKTEITQILQTAKFNLRKWITNDRQILNSIQDHELDAQPLTIVNLSDNESSRTLGLFWQPHKDHLHYYVSSDNYKTITKRSVLSMISRIYDPLHLLGPIHIRAKIYMQALWKCQLGWDDPIKGDLLDEWLNYVSKLKEIEGIIIPRRVLINKPTLMELHGFSDASLKAYAACVYVKSKNNDGEVSINLLCAKSRVSPLRNISLPRLELCGALLLAKLMKRVRTTLDLTRILLVKWKTYVANRVSQIQTLSNASFWHHVSTKDNAADILTRGCDAEFLKGNDLWWYGPEWLKSDINFTALLERPDASDDELLSESNEPTCMIATENKVENDLFNKFSNFRKLRRVTAYVLRFIHNARKRDNRRTCSLTANELKDTENILLRLAQQEVYDDEIKLIKKNETSKKLLLLKPFIDDNGLLRVGGRLKNSLLPFENKHQIILPQRHIVSRLIAEDIHVKNFHCGPQLLLGLMRDKYWPVGGRNLVRSITRKCMKCSRLNPQPLTPLMGELPLERVGASFAFEHVGIDYAGPFMIKDKRTRG